MSIRNRYPRRSTIERELTRLADGTLNARSRRRVERVLVTSPELQARLREQRRAVAATRTVAQRERAPIALRLRRPAPAPPRRARRTPAFAAGLAGTAGAVVWSLVALGGGGAGLTVAQAATLATRPPVVAVAQPRDDQVTLPHLRAAGLPFPYWEDRFHWRATGSRTDLVDGRTLTTVFYRRGDQSIAYTIVSGAALGGAARERIVASSTADRQVVSWLRRGHTCVLSGRGVPFAALIRLADWRDHGRIPY